MDIEKLKQYSFSHLTEQIRVNEYKSSKAVCELRDLNESITKYEKGYDYTNYLKLKEKVKEKITEKKDLDDLIKRFSAERTLIQIHEKTEICTDIGNDSRIKSDHTCRCSKCKYMHDEM